ncbi:hypothetical protein Pint_05965 [Pistacia integerrima]|uniref:Uncharacterized protein n=1 Tax=Pistacia integerrima TaxID=434235 RepID=A0ACC0Z4E8_9ROSI|nr:hypothetical protein Pint_05965 [Pistacia integerrima]
MALFYRLRAILNPNSLNHRHISASSILSPPVRRHDPRSILGICLDTSLTLNHPTDHRVLLTTVSKLSEHPRYIEHFLQELKT